MIMLLRWIARIGGLVALVLGLMMPRSPMPGLHMALGGLVAVALAILAAWALAKGVRRPVALAGVVWAIGVVRVGMMIYQYFGIAGHPVIRIAHAVLGIGAIGLAEVLAAGLTPKTASLA